MLRAFQSRGWGVGKGDVSSSPLLPKFSFDVQFFADEPFNLIQDGGRGAQKGPPTSFSPVTSTNVGFGRKTFWILVLILLPNYCKISSSYLVPVPNYWTWTKTTSQKKRFFWSNPYKIEVIITFLIEMLQLLNFGHMTTSII